MTYIDGYTIFKGGITYTDEMLVSLFVLALSLTIVILIGMFVHCVVESSCKTIVISLIIAAISIAISIIFYFNAFKTYYSVSKDILKDPVAMEQLTKEYEIIMPEENSSSEYLKLLPK